MFSEVSGPLTPSTPPSHLRWLRCRLRRPRRPSATPAAPASFGALPHSRVCWAPTALAAHQMPELYLAEKTYNHHAVTATFINPNHLATLLGFGSVAALALLLSGARQLDCARGDLPRSLPLRPPADGLARGPRGDAPGALQRARTASSRRPGVSNFLQ